MSTWFRLHAELLNDPKVQSLPPKAFKTLVNLWCIACKNDGIIPESDLPYVLRMRPCQVSEMIDLLFSLKLLERDDGKLTPHNWSGRQYLSDNSYERVKRHRAKRAELGLQQQWQPSETLRHEIYERDGYKCVYCASENDLTIDHKIPSSKHGTNDKENLQTLCRPCNASKRDMTHDEYIKNETLLKRPQNREQKTEQNRTDSLVAKRSKPRRRLPGDWQPRKEDRDTLSSEGFSLSEIETQVVRFRDYWTGTGKPMVDWDATFRNWVRRSAEMGPGPPRKNVVALNGSFRKELPPEPPRPPRSAEEQAKIDAKLASLTKAKRM